MANTIHLQLLENKAIVAEVNGYPYTYEGGYRIVAGEKNATNFIIKSTPYQYQNARFTVEMVNSEGKGIEETTIDNNSFSLPLGMAVAGYGKILIRGYLGNETIIWTPLKIKVWNTLPNWKDGITTEIEVIQNGWFEKEVYETDDSWLAVGTTYQIRIPATEHGFTKIKNIKVELINNTNGIYENMVYTYHQYYSGSVSIVLDKKINCKITIQGDK